MAANQWSGPQHDVAAAAGHRNPPPRVGFFTDTSVCIGCKACEVACKEWNAIPEDGLELTGMSFDNTQGLGADSWRHVAFIEERKTLPLTPVGTAPHPGGPGPSEGDGGHDGQRRFHGFALDGVSFGPHRHAEPSASSTEVPGNGHRPGLRVEPEGGGDVRWLMSSDVCKHCTHAACLDVCPTGALVRTEYGTVVVQEDVCNGCGYCVPACPYGVIDQREQDGRVFKCTMCYDRLGAGLEPACAKACPTDSIQFGPLDELRERAAERVEQLRAAGVSDARLYGHDPDDGVGGDGAFFLLLDKPEVYGLPPDPVVTTRDLPDMWRHAGVAALTLLGVAALSFAGGRR